MKTQLATFAVMATILAVAADAAQGVQVPARARVAPASLPEAALQFRVFRQQPTPGRNITASELSRLRNTDDPHWEAIYAPIGGPSLLEQARHVEVGGLEMVAIPGPIGIAVAWIRADGAQLAMNTYAEAAVGGLAGFARQCSEWAPNDIDCAAPDGGHLTMYQLAPDGVRSVSIAGVRPAIVDNVLAADVGPLSLQDEMLTGLAANRRTWTKLAAKRRAAVRRALAKKRAAAKRARANRRKGAFAG